MANADIVITTDPENQVTIESLIDQNDLVLNDVATMRNIAIGKLANAVSTMSLNLENSDPEVISAKLSAIDSLDRLLTSKEKSFSSRINVRLKQKELSNNTQTGAIVTELLSRISSSQIVKPPKENVSPDNPFNPNELQELETQCNTSKDITPINDAECKLDPKDYDVK